MKKRNLLIQATTTILVFVFIAFAGQLLAQDIVASKWQMHRGEGTITFKTGYYGDPLAYSKANIPSLSDGGWVTQTDGINISEKSTIPCLQGVDFTYFQTIVDVPSNTTINDFKITFSKVDDGARAYIFNSKSPNGSYVEGGDFILNKTKSAISNFHSKIVAGEANRIVVVQFDNCASGNNISGVDLVINGTVEKVSNKTVNEIPMKTKVKKGKGRGHTHILNAGETLKAGERLTSPNGAFILRMQEDDGNLCIYHATNGQQGAFVWGSMKYGFKGAELRMQTDGNLVVYAEGEPKWATETMPFFNQKFAGANKPVQAILTDKGHLILRNAAGKKVWTSNPKK